MASFCVWSPKVNTAAIANMWPLSVALVTVLLGFGNAAANASTPGGGDSCERTLTTPAWFMERNSSIPFPHGQNFTFSVTTCHDAHVILSSDDVLSGDVYEIVIGGWNNTKSAIRECVQCEVPLKEHTHKQSPLSCNESKAFYISLENQKLNVGSIIVVENGTEKTQIFEPAFLTHGPDASRNFSVNYVFVNNFHGTGAEWRIDEPCSPTESPEIDDGPCKETEVPVGDSAGVSQGHLAGSVIAALLAGLVVGCCAMYFGPKLWNMWIVRRKDTQKKKKKTEEAKGEEELTTLVTDQPASPEKVTTQGAPVIPRPLSEDLPEAPAVPDTPRKTSNAYTPYKSMKGSARPSDDVKPPDITTKRPTAPLPELPGGAKGGGGKAEGKGGGGGGGKAEEPEPPDEVYINQDAHVYEGVRHDLPIYENRDVRMYESLKVAKK